MLQDRTACRKPIGGANLGWLYFSESFEFNADVSQQHFLKNLVTWWRLGGLVEAWWLGGGLVAWWGLGGLVEAWWLGGGLVASEDLAGHISISWLCPT